MVLPQPTLPEEVKQGAGEPRSAEVKRALAEIIGSQPFRKSAQCSRLLRYIVNHTLSGEDNLLRERVIGAEVFDRPPEYEPGQDPVVRLRVAEVRKRLAQYYQSSTDNVLIGIPSGSYRASFHLKGAAASARSDHRHNETDAELPALLEIPLVASPRDPLKGTETPIPRPASRRALILSAVAGILLLCCAIAFVRLHGSSDNRDFKVFWKPWRDNPKPTIISVGSNAVYRLQWAYVDRYAKEHGLEASGQEFYIPFKPGDTILAGDLQPAYNSFVSTSDVSAISDITTALTTQSVSFQERFPGDISFAELRSNPTVLVGGFNNPMTIELTKHLPFVMRSGNEIDETQNPNRKWTLHVQVGAHDTADYAIITRLAGNSDDPPLMSVAGLGGFGTEAAAKLVADPKAIETLVRDLPKGWEKKNLQVVLSFKISDFKIIGRDVVAARVW